MVDTGIYQIINAKSNTALDASASNKVIGWRKHGGLNQKWYIEKRNNGRYTIGDLSSGKYLGLASTSYKNDLHARTVDDDWKTEWQICTDEQDKNAYRFFVPGTSFNLDLTGHGNSANGTPVAIWDKGKGKNQCWYLIRDRL